jgi:threonyl-tRNA synthetase
VVGQREAEAGTVAVRIRGAGNKQEVMSVEDFVNRVTGQIKSRQLEI